MSPETTTPNTTKICPTCGTRLGINATRCSVCGSNLAPSVAVASNKAVAAPRLPVVTLSLPVLFGLVVLLLAAGAGGVYAVFRGMGNEAPVSVVLPTGTATASATPTVTVTPTASSTPTLQPTWTQEPPLEYRVVSGDTCGYIAFTYGVSVNSIVILNGLAADCSNLSVGQVLQIPRPTPTASPEPTRTPNATEMAQAECEKMDYIVKDGDTLSSIAANYGITMASVRAYNGLNSDVVYVSQKLVIPLCEQVVETPTPTPVPPYAAPNLLLPADGASYISASDVITLQWSSVGELRQNEAYAVTIEDVTEGNARKLVQYVTDQKFIVPETFRPTSTTPHVFRWSVLVVRQTGTDKDSGNPIWEPGGAVSIQRVFSWVGTGSPPPQPTAAPAATATP